MKTNKNSSPLSSEDLLQLFKACAEMDELSGDKDDFLSLLDTGSTPEEPPKSNPIHVQPPE